MINPLTMQIESRMGAAFISLMAIFMAGILFVAIKNYDSDQIVLNASATQVKSMSSTERQIIAQWVNDNNIVIPDGKGYNYLTKQYPNRPWMSY
mgnify:CR=1 FL=1